MDDSEWGFSSIADGIFKVREDIENELKQLNVIYEEQKKELQKSKRFNILMFVIAIISLVVALAGFVISLVTLFK